MFGWYRRSRHVSVRDDGREQREVRDLQGVRAMVARLWAIPGTDLWEMVEDLAQDGQEIMCLHVYKGGGIQKFDHWTVGV